MKTSTPSRTVTRVQLVARWLPLLAGIVALAISLSFPQTALARIYYSSPHGDVEGSMGYADFIVDGLEPGNYTKYRTTLKIDTEKLVECVDAVRGDEAFLEAALDGNPINVRVETTSFENDIKEKAYTGDLGGTITVEELPDDVMYVRIRAYCGQVNMGWTVPCHDMSCGTDVWWDFEPATRAFLVYGSSGGGKMVDSASGHGPWYDTLIRFAARSVEISSGVENIGAYAFEGFDGIESVVADNATHLKEIGEGAFWSCYNLKSISLPESLERVGDDLFFECDEDLVVTGYASYETGNTISQYCNKYHHPFNALNGDLGAYTLDLSSGAAVFHESVAAEQHAASTIYGMFGTLINNGSIGIPTENEGAFDLDKNGTVDVVFSSNASEGASMYAVAETNSVKGSKTFSVAGEDRYRASMNSPYGFYYSSFTVRTSTIPISQATATVKAQTYTGKALAPVVTVKIGGTTLKAGTDYTVAYSNNKNAGNAKAAITGTGDYAGTIVVTFKIEKAKPVVKAKKSTVSLKASKVKKKARVVANLAVTCDKGKATYKNVSKNKNAKKFKVNKKNGKVTVSKGTKKGTYAVKVKVKVKAGANYKKLTKTVAFKVKVK